jgi:hypothetical protein
VVSAESIMPQFEARAFEQNVQNAISATENKKVSQGIKGPSFLMTLKSYDIVKSNAIDYMHGVLLGLNKLLIQLWISSTTNLETCAQNMKVTVCFFAIV